jgi:addiction module HigA family antidote
VGSNPTLSAKYLLKVLKFKPLMKEAFSIPYFVPYGYSRFQTSPFEGEAEKSVVCFGQWQLAHHIRISRWERVRTRLRGLPLMAMHNPPHPGEFIRSVYLEPFEMSARALAEKLAVSPSTLNRIITGKSGISPEMALRLSKSLGRSAESWLAMQDTFNLWQAKRHVKLDEVQHVEFAA